jgi:hypothetical protein
MDNLNVVSVTAVASAVAVAFEVLEQISSKVDACPGVGRFESPVATRENATTIPTTDRVGSFGLTLTSHGRRMMGFSPLTWQFSDWVCNLV